MSDYDNDLRGALFKNDKKESEKHPDYKGQCEVDGVEYWISAWLKKSKAGQTFMSLSFEAKDAKPKAKQRPKSRHQDDDDSDIPF